MREKASARALAAPAVLTSTRNMTALVCFLIAMIDGYDTLMMSFIAPLILNEWHLPPASFGKIFASTYAGAALGATVIGMSADRFGRRSMLLFSLALAGIFTILSATARNPAQLMLWRLIAGVGLGGVIPTISALTAAHAPSDRRSVAVTRMFIGFPIGAMLGGALTAVAMSWTGWRGILVSVGVCALLLLPLVGFVITEHAPDSPESPRPGHARRPFMELLQDGRAWGTILLCTATLLTLLVSYFLISWTPTVLTLRGANPQRAALASTLLNVGGVAGAWIVSSIARGRSLLLCVAGYLCVGSLLIATLGHGGLGTDPPGLLLLFAVGLLIIGAQLNFAAMSVYFYPASVCATGVGLSMAIGRLGSILGPLIGGYLAAAHVGWDGMFLIASIPALVAGLAIGLMGRSRAQGAS